MPEIPRMLSIEQTAAEFGIAKHYARTLALSGKVKAVRCGRGKILVNVASVAEYFNTSRLTDTNDDNKPVDVGIRPVKL